MLFLHGRTPSHHQSQFKTFFIFFAISISLWTLYLSTIPLYISVYYLSGAWVRMCVYVWCRPEHAPAPGLDIGPVGTDEDRTSEDEYEAEAEDADNDAKEEEVDAAGKDALSSLLSLDDDSECDVDITVASSLLSLADADDADNDNKDDADDARGATARARTSSLSLSSTATETATGTAAAFPCATASSRGLMHPPAARPRPPLASLPRSLVASSAPSMSAPKQRRSLPLFIADSTRASSGPLPASASSRSTDASASSTGMPVSLFLAHLSITLLVF